MLGVSRTTLHRVFTYAMVVPRVLMQHWIRFFLMQCCLEPQRQHYIRFFLWNVFPVQEILVAQYYTDKNPVQYCPRSSKQHCTSKNYMHCCSWGSRQQCTWKRPVQCYSSDNNAQVKTLYNVVGEAPDNIAKRNQKTPVKCFLNTPRLTLNRSKPYAMLSEKLQTTLHMKKFCSMLS